MKKKLNQLLPVMTQMMKNEEKKFRAKKKAKARASKDHDDIGYQRKISKVSNSGKDQI